MHPNDTPTPVKVRYLEIDRGHGTPCWEWQMGRDHLGYGRVRVNKRHISAHRHYWELRNGDLPEGLEVDHLCKNRCCVNPDHLEAVTRAENVRRSSSAKLNADKVGEIRSLEGTMTGRNVARLYSVHPSQIYRIWSGERWVGVRQHESKKDQKSA